MGSCNGGGCGNGIEWQCENGSPVYPELHEHIGIWFITLQTAFWAQRSSHGFLHFWLIQARLVAHSAFKTHSGRHPGGLPM